MHILLFIFNKSAASDRMWGNRSEFLCLRGFRLVFGGFQTQEQFLSLGHDTLINN